MLVFVNDGLERALEVLITEMEAGWELGLYKNDWTPAQGDDIGDVTACDFSGYTGLEPLANFSAPVQDGTRWKTEADPIVQSHNGGGTSNLVYGYYVVNGSGVLMYAERDPSGPRLMAGSGDVYTVIPRVTDRSEP